MGLMASLKEFIDRLRIKLFDFEMLTGYINLDYALGIYCIITDKKKGCRIWHPFTV